MKTLLTSAQMRNADEFTIINTPITSLKLMERAANAFVDAFLLDEHSTDTDIAIFCGKGNNGGDGLAIARLLLSKGFSKISVYVVGFLEKQTEDFTANLERLKNKDLDVLYVKKPDQIYVDPKAIIIDAIFGSGLNKPLAGDFEMLVANINGLGNKIYAVDVPSGFFADGELPENYNGIKAYKTICFQRPKINFFFPESVTATRYFSTINIGLSEKYLKKVATTFFLTEKKDIKKMLKPRRIFSYKGTFGHALIVAGNESTMGAALLCSTACLNSGAGLTTACIPKSGLAALNTLLPEVMAMARDDYTRLEKASRFQVIAVGPGLGVSTEHNQLLESLLVLARPMVIDADALNMLAEEKGWLQRIPANSVITPHVKEFDRLFGNHDSWWTRVETAKQKAKDLNIVIVLKNQYTFVCLPDATAHINPTGNPAMAQGGMGDVLTGIIAAFIAQGYAADQAAILGCYLHGKAGDALARKSFVVSASSVARRVPKEVKKLIQI
ncbi:hydroxyethylthiazole kinase-like uncharacterized protein yjeF [Pedobacter sp. UYP30]|uniref:NAD(P)H-hydrate dehydratase n=1 Tax=Pedobacter sp. UYP30 TaxID=1756400 RepID=UPI00339B4530